MGPTDITQEPQVNDLSENQNAESVINPPVEEAPALPAQQPDVSGLMPQGPAAPQLAKVPFWKSLLQGALFGLAGSAGSKSFAGGAAQGTGAVLNKQATDKANLQAQQKDFTDLTNQIRFRGYQDALNASNLSMQATRLDNLKASARQEAQKAADEHAVLLQTRFGIPMKPIAVGAAGMEPTLTHLAQASKNGADQGGAEVSPLTVVGPDTMYVPDTDGSTGPAKNYEYLKVAGQAFGLPVKDRNAFLADNPQQQAAQMAIAGRMLMGSQPSGKDYGKGDEAQLNAAITQAQAGLAKAKQDPNADPRVSELLQQRLDHLQIVKNGLDQANNDAMNRQIKVAGARGQAFNDSKIVATTDANGITTNQRAKDTIGQVKDTGGAMYVGSLPDGRQVAGTPGELQAAGTTSNTKMSSTEQSKVVTSRQLVAPNGLFHQVAGDIARIEQNGGNIDAIGSRWKEFWAGKLNTDPNFQQLRTSMGLLDTALMQAHVGARGGHEMLTHFKHLADYSVSDGPTLKAALSAEFKYATEKAAFIPKVGK